MKQTTLEEVQRSSIQTESENNEDWSDEDTATNDYHNIEKHH